MTSKKFVEALTNPNIWFDYSKQQRQIADILMDSMMKNDFWLKIKETDNTDDFATVFVNAHYHWGIAIENGFKALIIKYQPASVEYEIVDTNLIVKKIGPKASKTHDLLQLAEVTGVLKPEYKLYKYETDYTALKEVLKHLTDMIRWGARYPLPMNSTNIYRYSGKTPRPLVYGFHILDVMQPLFEAFDKEVIKPSSTQGV